MAVDGLNHVVNRVKSQDRHDWAENLFLHDRILPGNTIHNSRFDFVDMVIKMAAMNNFTRIDESGYTVKMPFADHLSVQRVAPVIGTILTADLLLDTFNKSILYTAVAENIIRSNTGLTAVQKFSEYDTASSQFQFRAFVDDAGAFSTQFQGRGSQISAGFFQHQLPRRLASGKEDVVKFLIQ